MSKEKGIVHAALEEYFNQEISSVEFVHWPEIGNPNKVDYRITFSGPRSESPEVFARVGIPTLWEITFAGDNSFEVVNAEELEEVK